LQKVRKKHEQKEKETIIIMILITDNQVTSFLDDRDTGNKNPLQRKEVTE